MGSVLKVEMMDEIRRLTAVKIVAYYNTFAKAGDEVGRLHPV
jgi:hypothetical protein